MAYSALVSLTHVLEQTINQDNQYLILDEKQQIESLLEKVSYLQTFLDNSGHTNSEKLDSLLSQIRDLAYTAEDIVESHITSRVHEESSSHKEKSCFCLSIFIESWFGTRSQEMSFATFFNELEKVLEQIGSINKRVDKIDLERDIENLQPKTSPLSGLSVDTSREKGNVVGLDNDIMEIKDRLTGGSSNLEIVSLVGMGGIGKTTLARNVYNDGLIIYHFYVRAWVTVSQDYNVDDILLGSIKKLTNQRHVESNEQLAELLYKKLKGNRYLIVMDDVWDKKVWDDVKRSFPNDKNGSRIMMTTRFESVAAYVNSLSPPHHMHFLDENESWNLFCEHVFGKDCCPQELEQVGKDIVQSCQGLPLAIVVIAGHLSKATRTEHYWVKVGKNLSAVMASNDEQCSKILSLSYQHLPHYLKGCFLYMGIFPEDFDISIPRLIKLWIAEGLLKSKRSKSLEDVAQEYLLELEDRNLIIVNSKHRSMGKIKKCRIHDVLRDLCVREARREKFFHIANVGVPCISQCKKLRRLIIHSNRKLNDNYLSSTLLRSVLHFDEGQHISEKLINSRLLRVLDMDYTSVREVPVNLRYLAFWLGDEGVPTSLYKLRNLQTLICYSRLKLKHLSQEIWKISQLRHVKMGRVLLPDPPSAEIEGEKPITVLEHLQTLSFIQNFRCTKEVLRRIPNLKKLEIIYDQCGNCEYYCLSNLVLLDELESLNCVFVEPSSSVLKNITFPKSLKKLSLAGSFLPWEDMTIVGLLPNIQVLKLLHQAFSGPEWKPNEGEFLQLKFLVLDEINLENWRADSIHFPNLQGLVISACEYLKEIPLGIGDIPTLQSIKVISCGESVVKSANKIQDEQLSLGNEGLQVRIMEPSEYFWDS